MTDPGILRAGTAAVIKGTPVVPGEARGPCLVLEQALSLWGGLDPETGRIIDPRHPQYGAVVTGMVLVMPTARGSSSSSSILLESLHAGTGPAAIILGRPDEILALGAIVAEEVFQLGMPLITVDPTALDRFQPGGSVEIKGDGSVVLVGGPSSP